MARRAVDYELHSKTARARLDPRPKPYYRQVAPGVTLGYLRKAFGPGSWQVRELVDGDYRYRTLGAADDVARADAVDVLTFAQAQAKCTAPAPTAAKQAGKLTVNDTLDAYLIVLAARSAHSKETRQRADKWIRPVLGAARVDRLTKSQVENWLAGMVKDEDPAHPAARRRSQDSANRILTTLKAALNLAYADEEKGIRTDSAWRRVKAFRDVGGTREDDFESSQVRLLIAKAATFDRAFANLLEAGYLTGARYGELVTRDVRHFNAKLEVLNVQGKTGARPITLTAESVAFFKRLTTGRPPNATLLPRADGDRWGKSEQARPFKRAAALAQLPASASFYTLRHSHISRAIEAGMPLSLLAENCGTSLMMIQRNYAHVLAQTRRDTVQATAPKLRRVK